MSRVEQFLLGGGHNRTAIHVGLVNNMPDAAMRATELRQCPQEKWDIN